MKDLGIEGFDKPKTTRRRSQSVMISNIKEVIRDFVDNSGRIKEPSEIDISNYEMDLEQINLAIEFVRVILDSRMLRSITKKYILSSATSLNKFLVRYNEDAKLKGESGINYNTLQTQVYRDEKKLEDWFNMQDPLMYLERYQLVKGNDAEKEVYNRLKSDITRASCMFFSEESKVYDQMLIKINRDAFNTELSEQEFREFIDSIKWYSKKVRDSTEKLISEREAGYFNYLLNSKYLTEEQQTQKRMIEGIFLSFSDLEEINS